MSAPLVSVIMPVHNAGRFVGEAMRSVLTQTFEDFELLTIDDASTDDSRAVIASVSDHRCRLLINHANLGAAEAKNRGLAEARGEFIAFLDADDVAMPSRFARQVDWLRANPGVDLIGSSVENINDNGDSLGRSDLFEPVPETLRVRLLFQNRIAQSSVMLRREALGALRFRQSFEPAEDYDLWVRLTGTSRLAVLADVLVRYRFHEGSVSFRKRTEMQRAVAAIHAAQLAGFGLCDTGNAHSAIVADEPIGSLALLQPMEEWLLNLQRANQERGLHPGDLFETELRARWLAIGGRAYGLGMAGWRRWRHSPFARGSGGTGIHLLGRAIRWELAHWARRF